jgi:hypothetical protein
LDATYTQTHAEVLELLERFAAEQWVAAHMTPEQAAASVLDVFKRTVAQELE